MHPELQRILNSGVGHAKADVSFDAEDTYVVHVTQDYVNPLALRRTAEIISELLTAGVASLLCIEEVSGEVPLAPLAALRARKANYLKPGRLVETGEIGYLEYLFLVLDRPIELWGVEDAPLFGKVHELSKSLTPAKGDWVRRFNQLVTQLHSEGLGSVSPEYAEFCRSSSPQGSDDLPPLELLIEYVNRLGLESPELHNYRILLGARTLEQAIDFTALNREREELQNLIVELVMEPERIVQISLEAAGLVAANASPQSLVDAASSPMTERLPLAVRMRRTPLGRLLLRALRSEPQKGSQQRTPIDLLALFEESFRVFHMGLADLLKDQSVDQAATGRLFNRLMEFMALLNLEQERFPNLVLYAHYLNRYLSTQLFVVPEELEGLRIRILGALGRQEIDRLHASLSERLGLLVAACQLQLTRRGVKRLQALSGDMSHEQLCADLDSFFPNSSPLSELRLLETEYSDLFDDAMLYYNLQDLRADGMVSNTLKRMRDSRQNTAVLVTGGFHEETIAESLTRHRISHTVVFPLGIPLGTLQGDSGRGSPQR